MIIEVNIICWGLNDDFLSKSMRLEASYFIFNFPTNKIELQFFFFFDIKPSNTAKLTYFIDILVKDVNCMKQEQKGIGQKNEKIVEQWKNIYLYETI